MRIIDAEQVSLAVARIAEEALFSVERGVIERIRECRERETNELSRFALDVILKNDEVSLATHSYPCQDTGLALCFVRLGSKVCISGKNLTDAINDGVRLAYREARKSVLDPLTRINTGDNTPAVVYTDIVDGDKLEIAFLAKGAGSENMSKIYMLTPSKGKQGIIDSAVACVKSAASNPCPPIILGIGIGGTMDKAAVLSKQALLDDIALPSPNEELRLLEDEILRAVNELGIGVQGFGGVNTCIGVKIKTFPTHIGMLPVAITIQCHSSRVAKCCL